MDDYERELEAFLEKGEFVEAENIEQIRKDMQESARLYFELQKSRPITLRVKKADLIKVKAKAKKNNIPYQTLLNTLIHQFAEGKTQVVI